MFFEKIRKMLPILVSAVLVWILTGCGVDRIVTPINATKPVSLVPYATPTASLTPENTPSTQENPTQLPTPTPTPMVYTIIEGDTMLAIAFRHGISLEELQSANPDVNARLLVLGTELIIPLGDVIPSNPVTPTPIPIQISDSNCYPAPDGVWCFVSIRNDRNRPLENISAQVVLQNSSGEYLVDGVAIGAINLLPVSEELPLVVFIPGRFPTDFSASTEILTVQLLPKNDERYLNAWLEVEQVEISKSGGRAQVAGSIGLPAKSQPGSQVWILVVAYDKEGNVVGIRKTEQFRSLDPGSSKEFDIEVFSLGSPIDEVDAFVEVRP